jgi:hypothetical protein
MKLPLLVQHYYKHQKKQSISLTAFLQEHYQSDHKDDDADEDASLPFKSLIVPAAITLDKATAYAVIFPPPEPLTISFASLPTFEVPSPPAFSIFHPPRKHLIF